jgi:processive 1,2-diacylglycerol beta-glucosyltransferase
MGKGGCRDVTDRSKHILILSASVGAGHVRAAEALELALHQVTPGTDVKNVDVLSLANRAFRRIYSEGYFEFARRAPHLLGYFYDLLDRPSEVDSESDRLRVAIEKLNMHPFVELLKSRPWDAVLNTHFLPAEIVASLRRKGEVSTPHMTITTDFETHRLWVHEPCEHYFTATAEGATYLEHWGIPQGNITVTGIPIHPVFSEEKDRTQCLRTHSLEGKNPIILLLSGGFGVGPIEKLYCAILDVDLPLEIVVASGRNEELREKLSRIEKPVRHKIKILGFTQKIDELMAVADVVISKPGGLTTAEILARGAAMAIVNPIPGQESRNSDFLLENGAGIKINNVATIHYKLKALLNDPQRLRTIKANAKRLGRPRAAFDVAMAAARMTRNGFRSC